MRALVMNRYLFSVFTVSRWTLPAFSLSTNIRLFWALIFSAKWYYYFWTYSLITLNQLIAVDNQSFDVYIYRITIRSHLIGGMSLSRGRYFLALTEFTCAGWYIQGTLWVHAWAGYHFFQSGLVGILHKRMATNPYNELSSCPEAHCAIGTIGVVIMEFRTIQQYRCSIIYSIKLVGSLPMDEKGTYFLGFTL